MCRGVVTVSCVSRCRKTAETQHHMVSGDTTTPCLRHTTPRLTTHDTVSHDTHDTSHDTLRHTATHDNQGSARMWAISRCETNWRAQCRVCGHSIASAVCAADAWVARAGAANAKFEGNGIIDATTPTRVKVAKRDKKKGGQKGSASDAD